jgi:hypothetical protein
MVLAVSAAAEDKVQAQGNAPITVLELFTSQGCSSCPPADALFTELAKREGVLALTMPVNYWDYLGWKDTLAAEEFSKRQRGYAEERGDHEIYTPQLIVNGLAQVVGSREEAITAAITQTRQSIAASRVPLSLACAGDTIDVEAGPSPEAAEYRAGTIWVALYSRSVKVDVRRGENYGRNLTYTNVVRRLLPAGRWEGKAASFHVTRPVSDDSDDCAAFLQADKSSAIIGAALMSPRTN